MTSLFLSPHNDDESLWGAFTLMREKPLVVVVTDSHIQENRGESITWDQRRLESFDAMEILGCPLFFGEIRDDNFHELLVQRLLSSFKNFDKVYAPAVQGGNPQHDLIGTIAKELFGDKCIQYTTYTKTETYTKGRIEVIPTIEEIELKNRALDCYKSQLGNTNKIYFDAVRGRSEWIA